MMQELTSFTGVQVDEAGRHVLLPARFPRLQQRIRSSCPSFLLKKALVVTVPGKEFGMEGHLRLSYAGTVKDVTEGHGAHQVGARSDIARTRSTSATARLVRDWL